MGGILDDYRVGGHFDEMFAADGSVRPHCSGLHRRLSELGREAFLHRQRIADLTFVQHGVTFTVYGDDRGTEKSFPFDLIPRVITAGEWNRIESGLAQRLRALNLFLHDVYHDQHILRDGVVPRMLALGAAHYRPEFHGADPPGGVYVHVAGSDLIRDGSGRFLVLEDNLRTPSGVSYMLENRSVLTRIMPSLFRGLRVRPVSDYPAHLSGLLRALAPRTADDPVIVLLTPGPYNSAYFEHAFLAQQLGIELVEGRDLVVQDNHVYMKTTKGLRRVDVVYRRI
ncbi:MAG: circularly permuted type 2 ATP-grasp protein, partial [Armatimonadota bacterium]